MSVVQAFVTSQRLGSLVGSVSPGTFGAAVTQTLPTWARAILGLVVTGVNPDNTAAEGSSGKLRINIKSLGVSNEEFLVGPYLTSGPATNNSGQSNVAEIIPLDIRCGGGEQISVDHDTCGPNTAGNLYELGILLTNNPGGIPADWKARFPNCVPFRGGKVENASQLTVVRTGLTAIKVPSWVSAIVAYKAVVTKTGAITAGEEGIGYFDIDNTMGITPIELISAYNTGAALGTPAGGSGQYANQVPYIPMYIPLVGKEETFTPYIVLRTAVSTANRVAIALAWR